MEIVLIGLYNMTNSSYMNSSCSNCSDINNLIEFPNLGSVKKKFFLLILKL